MNKDFSRIIALLRKERKLSQKQAATELNISQALLSHYEKGIRECGLDFVVKTADYYGVSCDYLLGRTPERSGATLTVSDLPESAEPEIERSTRSSLIATLNKKLIINSINVLFDILESTANNGLTTEVSNYLMVSVYKLFRITYSANPQNPQGMFSVSTHLYKGFCNALQSISEANAINIANGNISGDYEGLSKNAAPKISPEALSEKYSTLATSLFNLVQTTESKLKY